MNEVSGVWQCGDDFEVTNRRGTVEFGKQSDGGFYIAVDGYYKETFHMDAEQFAAFKQWVMEN